MFYVSIQDSLYILKSIDIDTKEVKEILSSEQPVTSLSGESSGLIVYTTTEGQIMLYNQQYDTEVILETSQRASDVRMCNDGSMLVCCLEVEGENDTWELWLYDFIKMEWTQLLKEPNHYWTPTFSKDKHMYYSVGRGPSIKLMEFSLSSGQSRVIIDTPDHYYLEESLSPSGNKLALSSNRKGDFDIWVYDMKNQEFNRITSDRGFEGRPSWISESEILYEANHPDHWGIWRINLHTLQKELVTPKGEQCRFPVIGY